MPRNDVDYDIAICDIKPLHSFRFEINNAKFAIGAPSYGVKWALLGSNQRPYACEAYALNQLS